jgi:hypothetical protein
LFSPRWDPKRELEEIPPCFVLCASLKAIYAEKVSGGYKEELNFLCEDKARRQVGCMKDFEKIYPIMEYPDRSYIFTLLVSISRLYVEFFLRMDYG